MKPAIYLKTKEGIQFYWELYTKVSQEGRDKLLNYLRNELEDTSKNITEIIENDKIFHMDIDDPYGWHLYHQETDKYCALNYFINRK